MSYILLSLGGFLLFLSWDYQGFPIVPTLLFIIMLILILSSYHTAKNGDENETHK